MRRSRAPVLACILAAAGALAAASLADTPPPTTGTGTTAPLPTTTVVVSTPSVTTPSPLPDPGPVQSAPPHPAHTAAKHAQAPKIKTTASTPARVQPSTAVSTPESTPPAAVVTPSPTISRPSTTEHTPRATPHTHRTARAATRTKRHVPATHPRRPVTHQRPKTRPSPITTPASTPTLRASQTNGLNITWTAAALGVGLFLGLALAALLAVIGARRHRTSPARPATSMAAIAASVDAQHTAAAETVVPSEPAEVLLDRPAPLMPECTITCWRGYVRSQFVAVGRTSRGEEVLIAESPFFAWRSKLPPPKNGPAVAAHEQLRATLAQLGWETVRSGSEWFELSFERQASVAPTAADVREEATADHPRRNGAVLGTTRDQPQPTGLA